MSTRLYWLHTGGRWTWVDLLLITPLVYLGWAAWQDELGVFPLETLLFFSGHAALILLLLTLGWGSLYGLTRWPVFLTSRKHLGLAAFAWTSLHLLLWLEWETGWSLGVIAQLSIDLLYIQLGWLIWLGLALLSATSWSWLRQRLTPRSWQVIHWLIYPLIALSLWHYAIVIRLDYTPLHLYTLSLTLLLGLRFWLSGRPQSEALGRYNRQSTKANTSNAGSS
ncbi:ferric reductase-like transmembrane domain-containing protein [Marinospirillum sp.]|uniref:ferric reductase-like transmembrane domain-containing protein n=1 Tax=Marinospirillum sp. TaxID=2183934 RepID=UPI003A8B7528